MRQKRSITLVFVLLTVVNVVIFYFRDHFLYRQLSSYASLYSSCDEVCENKWKQYYYDYPAADQQAARQITDPLVAGATNTREKFQAIAAFLYQQFHKQLGRPTAEILTASPVQQFRQLSANRSLELWCGNFAQMFSYFCWSQGIVCRNIEILNPGDHHVLNECYLPETSQWIIADLTNNMFEMRDRSGKNYNLQSFMEAVRDSGMITYYQSAWLPYEGSGSNVFIRQTSGPRSYSKAVVEYYVDKNPVHYYHRTNNEAVYSTSSKIRRYLLPGSWYEVLKEGNENNFRFWLKIAVLILWIISFFVFIITHAKFRK